MILVISASYYPNEASINSGENSKMKNFSKIILLAVLILLFSLINIKSFALEENIEEVCQSIEIIEKECDNLSASQCRALLEKCDEYYREKSAQIEKDLAKTQQEKKTLKNDIYTLRKKIENLSYQIYQSNLMIKDIGFQIKDTGTSIEKTSFKIEDFKKRLAQILRLIYEEDQRSIVEILIAESELSDFFNNLVALENLNLKNQEILESIKSLKSYLESQKKDLDEEKENLERVVIIQNLQKQESDKIKNEKDYFLKLTETEYQKQLQEKTEVEKRATEIRARIFELIGVPEAPTFGEALDLARYVEGVTGIRPAFLLAVLQQESNIGKNVGQCYLKNPATGAGTIAYNSKTISRVMKPTRDVTPFLQITSDLGRDPYNTPVSCPMSYGWGGAMGPAQFIPSTWVLYQDKVSAITGKAADPWNIKDAFLASAFYLTDYGASSRTYNGEWRAAMIYFSGTTSTIYRFYGDSVMKITSQFEQDIKEIEKAG